MRYATGANPTTDTYNQQHAVLQGASSETEFDIGLLNVHTFREGSNPTLAPNGTVSWNSSSYGPRPYDVQVLGNYAKYGRRRLVALGYEIHDTTANMLKQGTLTAYRVPQAVAESLYVGDSGSTVDDKLSHGGGSIRASMRVGSKPQLYSEYCLPPANLAEAMTYSGTRQWQAKEGAYVVCVQDVERNKLRFSDLKPIAFTAGDEELHPDPQSLSELMFGSWFTPTCDLNPDSLVAEDRAPNHSLSVPYHTSGIILTGLSQSSTFTVTLRATWEIAPMLHDQDSQSLVFLAKPSPVSDPYALSLYQQIALQLPVAVPVDMNAKGDFWDMVLTAARVAAKPVASLVPGIGGALGELAAGSLSAMQKRRNASAANKDKLIQLQLQQLSRKLDDTNFNSHGRKPKNRNANTSKPSARAKLKRD